MCGSPRFYCTVDLLREFPPGKLEQRDKNPVMVALSQYTEYAVFLIASFLTGVESEDQLLLNYLIKFCPVFLGSS